MDYLFLKSLSVLLLKPCHIVSINVQDF